jgi:hypothetical protein
VIAPARELQSTDNGWQHRQPGDLAAEWTARELARRAIEPLDASGNHTDAWIDWPPDEAAP